MICLEETSTEQEVGVQGSTVDRVIEVPPCELMHDPSPPRFVGGVDRTTRGGASQAGGVVKIPDNVRAFGWGGL